MKFTYQLSKKRILTFIHFSAYRTRIGTIPKRGERGRSKMQFRHKNTKKMLSKMRGMQIRNSDIITELALRKLNKEKKCERKNKIGTTNNDV